jgi:YihY family inner membrane protein
MTSIVPKDSATLAKDAAAEAARQTAALAAEQSAKATRTAEAEKPIGEVMPVVRREGLGAQLVALAKYMARSEVHTYAFSVAANAILSLFPFIVLLLTICRQVLHSRAMETVVADMMRSFLPTGQDFVIRNMQLLAHPQKGVQVVSVVMLLVSSTGVFLPLEVALNDVWGVKKNRSYLHNQVVSLGLVFAVGVLAMMSVASTAGQTAILGWVFFGHTQNVFYTFAAHGAMKFFAVVASIMLFFLIYWVLPFRKVPARSVLPTAIVIGLMWEVAKRLYMMALPWLDFQAVYGPFYISVGLMMWAFLSGLLLLAGAHFSATRYTLRLAREADREAKDKEAERIE